MHPSVSSIVSILFLLIGAVALYSMMTKLGSQQTSHPSLHSKLHKFAGWIFIVLFLVFFIVMLGRLRNYWEELPSRLTLHIVLALVLFLLLLVKVTIARFFPSLAKNLFLLGLGAYIAAFTLVGITGGYYLIRRFEHLPYIYHAELPEQMLDERLGKELFISKCSTCHMLKDVMKPRSKEAWEKVANEMFLLAEPRITADEIGQLLYYLTSTHVPKPFTGSEDASIVEKHCLPCHEAKDIYEKRFSRAAWMEILEEMNGYGPELVPKEKLPEIADFLERTQKLVRD